MKTKGLPFLSLLLILAADLAHGDSATWNLNPTSGDWNTAANWTPNTVPNGPDDIATFGVSNQTDVTVSIYQREVNELVFNPGASAFTITAENQFIISGTGITNNSGITQNFLLPTISNFLVFRNGATAGDMTVFTIAPSYLGAFMIFDDTSSAGHGTFIVEGDTVFGSGGQLAFTDTSSAANGFFMVNGGTAAGRGGGHITFLGTPGVPISGGSAGNGVFVINGGAVDDALAGSVTFNGGTSGNATLIAKPGANDGFLHGGLIQFGFTFGQDPDQSEARIELFGNGTLDVKYGPVTVGSIEGDGIVTLDGNLLITGANNLSTIFSGTIDGGSLKKIGTGILMLTGANTYTGGTTIEGGKLVVNNRSGSGTGSGAVQVNAGILAGRGTIAGTVIVGTGSGAGAALAPGRRGSKPDTLTIQGALTFQLDSTYKFEFKASTGAADKVTANGVTINTGALVAFIALDSETLPQGTVLTAISNTAATPIAGTFANLADDSTITIGSNTFQANYEAGDGNDLTLTVVP